MSIIDSEIDDEATALYGRKVGERLRSIRRQKGLSLQDAEESSGQEFKASVLGAYERGERAISVPRLQRLARFYNVPVDQLLPRDRGADEEVLDLTVTVPESRRIVLDLTKLDALSGVASEMLTRYLTMIQVQRQDFNGRVLTIRRDDLRAIACILDTTEDGAVKRLDDLGLVLGPLTDPGALDGGGPRFGAYLHVPFCRHRCDYCAFATWTDRDEVAGRYLEACRRHAATLAPDLPPVTSVFVGGGTPSRVDPTDLLAVVHELPVAAGAEVTIECNPEDLDPARARAYAAGGVTRVSVGVQSTVPHVLTALGRVHPAEAVAPAVAAAQGAGLEVNVDLIYGARGESLADWRTSVQDVIALGPDHVSAYALTVEAGTPLWDEADRHPDDDDQADKYALVTDLLGAAGYEWYEISNWARPGRRCRHNLLYWSMGDYVALGCAAHGHREGVRYWHGRTPERYLVAIEEDGDPVAGSERLAPDARALEALQLSLRTVAGVPVAALTADDRDELAPLLRPVGDRVVLSTEGRLLANEVALRLVVPPDQGADPPR